MVSVGSYVLGALVLVLVGGSVAFTAYRLRQKLLPAWTGAPGRLVEAVVAVALLIWIGQLLGTLGLFYAWIYVAVAVAIAGLTWALRPAGPVTAGKAQGSRPRVLSRGRGACGQSTGCPRPPAPAPPAGGTHWLAWLLTIGVVGLVVAHWGITAKDALDRGIFNFDSLWYHMPFAVDMAKSHSTTGLHYVETVFTNWFYPQNAELLHATGILLVGRDTLSLFLNFAFLGLAFLAAWCIGSPYGRGHLTVIASAILLECHTLVVREPGAAKNDLVAAALLLAAAAILVQAQMHLSRGWRGGGGSRTARGLPAGPPPPRQDPRADPHRPAATGPAGLCGSTWAVAAAGLAAGLAVGTKSTAVAMAAALTLAVIALAPSGRRWATFAWWFVPALLGGGYWYLRNLIVAGNPLPQATSIGPISLPHPERLQEGRPNFNIAHYATDTGVWRHYFEPGLHQAFGALWPIVLAAAIAGGLLVLLRGREPVLRWLGAVSLFGLLAYVFTPLSAAGADGAPVGFGINIRYAIPPLLLGLTLLPLALPGSNLGVDGPQSRRIGRFAARRRLVLRGEWALMAILLVVLVVTNRANAVFRDPARVFGLTLAVLVVAVPAALIWLGFGAPWGKRLPPAGGAVGGTAPEDAPAPAGGGGSPAVTGPAGRRPWSLTLVGFATLILLLLALGYPLQRHYLSNRFGPQSEIPGLHMDAAYHWARDKQDARIGIVGTTAGFLEYGLYGTDLSNHVVYLGEKGPHGAFNAIPTCSAFRAAVNRANLEYLITAPFLNFLHPGAPVPSPEAGWLKGSPASIPIHHDGPVTTWRINGRLDPSTCGPANAPLRRVPNTPST